MSSMPMPTPTEPTMIDVVELSIADAQRALEDRLYSSRELTQAYVDRIDAIDRHGPALNSVIELNAAALSDADRLDGERAQGRVRGALHGIPILLKDNIDAVGMINSAGSLALANHRPRRDAFVTTLLRNAGAVILGKTNLSEWANFRGRRSTSGWSSRGGQTKNPYVLDRNPSGSSSGTAAAIAASLATAGVGTETNGSIISPSSLCGLVGLKPTVGVVSRSGIIPISISQDTAGPMCRTVADAAALLTALAGVDPADPAATARNRFDADYTAHLDANALNGKRLGIDRKTLGFNAAVDAALELAIEAMTAAGATIVDVDIGDGSWNRVALDVLLYEFKDGIDAYLARNGIVPGSLAQLIEWNAQHRETVMPSFQQELFERAQAKGPLTDRDYLDAREKSLGLARAGLAKLDEHRLDAFVQASGGPAWLTDHLLGDHGVGGGAGIAAVAGTPSLTVPIGDAHGLPLGMTFIGRAFAEPTLLALAFAFEEITHARRPPQFVPSLALGQSPRGM
jgi:amidase